LLVDSVESMMMHGLANPKLKKKRQALYYKLNIEALLHNHYCCRKTISITYAEGVFLAIGMWHVKRIRHIILSSLACLVLPHHSTLFRKRHDFREKGF